MSIFISAAVTQSHNPMHAHTSLCSSMHPCSSTYLETYLDLIPQTNVSLSVFHLEDLLFFNV